MKLSKQYLGYATALCFIILVQNVGLRAQDHIPETSGFSGYALAIPGVFFVQSNLLVSGAPLLKDVGTKQIESIYQAPESRAVPALPISGEINYTFRKSRTQFFFGNRLVDIIRLDAIFGLGVRQELGRGGILVANVLITPLELKYWSDPYIEGEERSATNLNFPGFRVRWGRIFQTNFEITMTARKYKYENERSGEWLVDQGRLTTFELASLIRNGNFLEALARYKIMLKQHRLQPVFRYASHNHQGGAVASRQSSILLEYFYSSSKMLLNAKLIYGKRKANDIHPVYDTRLNTTGYGFAIGTAIPVTIFNSSSWNLTMGGQFLRENANIDFYTTRIAAVTAGLIWRPKKE